MGTIQLPTGLLAGRNLQVWQPDALADIADSLQTKVENVSVYRGELRRRKTFRGVAFENCNFARTRFEGITFRKCSFTRVDLTRSIFVECSFSECNFVDCDPYNARFIRCVVDPSEFKNCYREDSLWNKALILFANLRSGLEKAGNGRMARVAEYHYRVWERRRLYWLWDVHGTSGAWPWFRSLCVAVLTGYGERPAYLGGWMLALITVMAVVYRTCLPYAVTSANPGIEDYW
jgi:Pentapeptide repeats (9 copies)